MSIYDPTVFNFIFAVFVAILGFVGVQIMKHIKNIAIANAVDFFETTIVASVKEVQQTMVDGMKAANADGALTDAEKQQVLAAVIASVKGQLSKDLLLLLGNVFGDLEKAIITRTQSAVWEKNNKK